MSGDKLAQMANQIATFFSVQPGDRALAVAAHINDNWSPPMRAGLLAQIAAGGAGLDPLVVEAGPEIRPAPAG
ncbi:MAG: formate dehydrogenase subunit delta [Paenirhodobacter sp.]|uniref:formate dehydrogenase subunit delta n=1 Tax=Paenirhodobacter sp. TaxID=1965326 RepID=UPI003D095AE2